MAKKSRVILPKGVHRVWAKTKYYYYHRSTKTKIVSDFGNRETASLEFLLELQQIEADYKQVQYEIKNKVGTLGFLIEEYKQSGRFRRLAPRSKEYYLSNLDYLDKINEMALITIDATFIRLLRNQTFKEKKRSFTNHLLAVMSAMFQYGIEYGYMTNNPRTGVKSVPKDKSQKAVIKNRAWSISEQSIILKTAKRHILLPVAISLYTGLRQGDVLNLHKNSIKDGWLEVETSKTKQIVKWPIHPDLQDILNIPHENNTVFVCVNSRGDKWTSDGFKTSFHRFKTDLLEKKLINKGLTFHGIRRTVATTLRQQGLSNEQIATALGHSSPETTNIYSKDVDLTETMAKVYSIFGAKKNEK